MLLSIQLLGQELNILTTWTSKCYSLAGKLQNERYPLARTLYLPPLRTSIMLPQIENPKIPTGKIQQYAYPFYNSHLFSNATLKNMEESNTDVPELYLGELTMEDTSHAIIPITSSYQILSDERNKILKTSLKSLLSRLTISLQSITTLYEIILVDDGCPVDSWSEIESFAKTCPNITGIKLSRNFGQHEAITAGLHHATGQWIVVMDCDLQDEPEAIPRLYARAQEGFDIVLARRTNRKDKAIKKITSRYFYKIFSYLSDMDYDPEIGNFRIISRQVVETCRNMRENLRFFVGMIDWMGFPTATVDVEHGDRFAGESTYTFRKLLKLGSDTIIAYSDKPLRLSIKLGFTIAAASFFAGLGLLFYAIVYDVPIMGWSSMIISLYFLGGIIIANLGIIGIYLGKTFDETKKRPLYIVMNTTFTHK